VELSPPLLRPLLAYCTRHVWWRVWSNRWNAWQGKPKLLCPPQIPHDLNGPPQREARD
jgi:hypothetical protein